MNEHQEPMQPTLFVVGPRRGRGRPRATEPRASICAWVPASFYDRLARRAAHDDKSISSLVRDTLMQQITND